MAQLHIKKPDELVTCPYNPVHRVKSIRFPRHVTKCAKNYNWVICPFNASHHMPESQRASHISTCPDRVMLEREVVSRGKSVKPNLQVPPYENDLLDPTEDWDAECSPYPVAGYDPTKTMNEVEFRNLQSPTSVSRQEKTSLYSQPQNHSSSKGSVDNLDDSVTDTDISSMMSSFSRLRLPKEAGIIDKMSKSVPYFGLGRGRGRIDAGDESYEKLRKPEVVDEEKFCLENV